MKYSSHAMLIHLLLFVLSRQTFKVRRGEHSAVWFHVLQVHGIGHQVMWLIQAHVSDYLINKWNQINDDYRTIGV